MKTILHSIITGVHPQTHLNLREVELAGAPAKEKRANKALADVRPSNSLPGHSGTPAEGTKVPNMHRSLEASKASTCNSIPEGGGSVSQPSPQQALPCKGKQTGRQSKTHAGHLISAPARKSIDIVPPSIKGKQGPAIPPQALPCKGKQAGTTL